MLDGLDRLDGRAAVLAATAGHPYARLTTGGVDTLGFQGPDLLGWVGQGPWGPIACALGDPARAVDLMRALHAAGRVDADQWVHLPRLPGPTGTPRDDWDFLWTTAAPPPVPGEDGVTRLTAGDDPAVAALLEESFPESTSRPGDPRVRCWYGIHDRARLVAAGADRSRGGVGFIAGLAVRPAARRQGLGAALAATVTRRLHAEFGTVSLGVMAHRDGPKRLYARLGYTAALARTTLPVSAVLR